jgi:hypothetical protein
VAAIFNASPKTVRVSKAANFTYSFMTAPLVSGQIGLQSTKKLRIGTTKQYARLAGAFVASPTGVVNVRFQLSRAYLRAVKRVKRLPFVVLVALGGKTYATTLTLLAPAVSRSRSPARPAAPRGPSPR